MRRAHSLLLCAALVSAACDSTRPAEWTDEKGYRWRPLKVDGGEAGFTALSARRTGIAFQNGVTDSLLLTNRNLGQGAGVAIGDVDGDGLPDVFLARTEGCSALYRNLGDWKFKDIAQQSGVQACHRNSTGAAFADFDGDRDLDLVLLATRGPNAVFVNDGRGGFSERRDVGLDAAGKGGTTIAMSDVDRDSDLDLFVANYSPYNVDDSLPPQQRAYSQTVRQVGPNQYEIVPQHRAHYRLVMRPDMGGLRMSQRGATDDFYLNDGGRFTRVPFSRGRFRGPRGERIEEQESFTLFARFADLNGDAAPDLYVANDFEDLDEFWFNDGRGYFRRADWTAQRQMSNSAMGADVADVNGDGLPDLFTVDMLSNDPIRLKTQIPTHTALPKRSGDMQSQLQQQRNTLYLNRGDGTFTEVAAAAGVEASGWSWATMLLDVDLDGWQDILIANGHLWDMMDGDTYERLQNRMPDVSWRRLRWEFPPLKLRNVAFRNRGDLTFEDVSQSWNFGIEEDISHALAAGDLDVDGDPDVIVNRLGSPALVLRNDAIAARVSVRLSGEAPNTRAVGAKVRLHGGAVPIQEREITVGGLYLSHSDYDATFSIGQSDTASLVVDWPDGQRTTIPSIRPNRQYEIFQVSAAAIGAHAERGTAAGAPVPQGKSTATETLFADATSELGGHKHVDSRFDDWDRQFLLPMALSHLGPGIAFFDFDRDGDEDMIVGAGRSGRLGVMVNNRSGFVARQGPAAEHDLTTVLGLRDANGTRVLAGQSTWEAPPPLANSFPAVIQVALAPGAQDRTAAVTASAHSSTGAMALADYDRDGDLDLFVGGRVIPGAYPRPASSQLFRSEDGRFVPDDANRATLDNVGLVSAASFADVDGDGDADLLLAREWDSILLLLNHQGRFTAAPTSFGLARWTNRWNGIATGDLDGDGRLDIVATAWGRNTMMHADSARPLVMLHGSFGARGQEELLIARKDRDRDALVPLNSFPPVRATISDLPDRIRSFRAYAEATVEQVLGPAMSRVQRKQIITHDHMVFLNRGSRFEGRPLPLAAQLAPAFYAGIADFDGDGAEDVFLSQNFYPTAIGLPRYDAGRGVLLRGDGRGGLHEVSAAHSGLRVYGDMRGAAYADFDGDARLDLAITQNSAETRLYRNRGAKPGLRVRLQGSTDNPDAVGAQVRLAFGDRLGPVREIQAGSGYWSQNGAVQVFGTPVRPTAVRVRWPNGDETISPVPFGATEVVVRR